MSKGKIGIIRFIQQTKYQIQDYLIMGQLCQSQVILHARDVIEDSAHGMFQMGHYYDCLETPGFNYNLVLLAYEGANTGIFGGLCLPNTCTPEIIKKDVDIVLDVMGMPYRVGTVMDDIQGYQYPFTWLFYLTIIILTTLVALTLYATLSKSKHRLLKGISLRESLKIFKSKESDLNVFNGVRAVAMMWVVFGHYYFNSVTSIVNTMNIDYIFTRPFLLLVETGLTAVDIFFFLGGFFLAYVFMRQKTTNPIKYPIAILQRILRIWPAYIIVMMFYYSVYLHLGEGPMWSSQETGVKICSGMWKEVLFISNFVQNGNQICLNWGWYLQVDFQIFLVCVLLLFLYTKINRLASYVTAAALVIFSIAFNIAYTQRHQQKLFTNVQALMSYTNYFLDIYIKPYARWTPYFMGLYLGIFYHQYQQSKKTGIVNSKAVAVMNKIKEKLDDKKVRIVVEWSGIAVMAFLTFILRTLQTGHQWDQVWHSLYACLEKPFFIIGLLMVTFPSVLGCKGSFFQLLLDNTILNFIAKISFCTYLVHLMVILQYISSRTFDNYYSLLATFTPYLGCLVASCFFGFLMTIFVELPFSVWQKELMKRLMTREKGVRQEKSENLISDKINMTIDNESQIREVK